MNKNNIHTFIYLNTSGVVLFEKIRRCGLVGRSLSHTQWLSLFLLPVDLDIESSAISPALCLSVCHHAPCHDETGLNLSSCKPASGSFLFKSSHGHGVSSQQQNADEDNILSLMPIHLILLEGFAHMFPCVCGGQCACVYMCM